MDRFTSILDENQTARGGVAILRDHHGRDIRGVVHLLFFRHRAPTVIFPTEPKTCVNCHLMAPLLRHVDARLARAKTPPVTIVTCRKITSSTSITSRPKMGAAPRRRFTVRGEAHSLQTIDASSEVIMDKLHSLPHAAQHRVREHGGEWAIKR